MSSSSGLKDRFVPAAMFVATPFVPFADMVVVQGWERKLRRKASGYGGYQPDACLPSDHAWAADRASIRSIGVPVTHLLR